MSPRTLARIVAAALVDAIAWPLNWALERVDAFECGWANQTHSDDEGDQ